MPSPVVRELRKVLDRRERDARTVYPMRVEGRNGDGTINVRRFDGECIERSRECGVREGQLIEVPCGPPPSLAGAAGVAMLYAGIRHSVPWIESLVGGEPDAALDAWLLPGESYTLTVTGKNFEDTLWIDFLLAATEEVHPDITVTDLRVLSDTSAEVDVTVDAGASPIDSAPISYDNVGSAL